MTSEECAAVGGVWQDVWHSCDPNLCGLADVPDQAGETERFTVHPTLFSSSTTLTYRMDGPDRIEIAIYDVAGRCARALFSGVVSTGVGSVVWDGRDDRGEPLGSGIYFCRLRYGGGMPVTTRVIRLE